MQLLNTKNFEFNPTAGTLFELKLEFYSELVGGDFDFQKLVAHYNRYLPLDDDDRRTIAVRGT